MMLQASASVLLLLAGGSRVAAQQRHATEVSVPANINTTRVLHRDLYGFSIEPVWVNDFIENNMTATLLRAVADVAGVPPPIRVGGNTADQTFLVEDGVLNDTAVAIPAPATATRFNISKAWFGAWGDYFPEGTNLTFALNFHNNASDWANALAQAEAVWDELGTKLVRLELGNEVDHFINKGWRNSSWGVDMYAQQFRRLTSLIRDSQWFRDAGDDAPVFAAGSFADPPWVPDQHDQLDDMDILNLTSRAGLVNDHDDEDGLHIDSYVVHMYPQSTCDPERWHRMRLDLLSNHTVVWLNVSQYEPQVEAAENIGGAPLVMGETNSISCSGRSGISDTLGAALWSVDYTLSLAAIGLQHVYYHLGAQSEYAAFVPLPHLHKGEQLEAGVRPGFYAQYFIAHVVGRPKDDNTPWSIAALPDANASDFSGFGIYSGDNDRQQLKKLVFLDMGVWNGTEGLSNPSTISAADNVDTAFHSNGSRPVSNMTASTPWCEGSSVRLVRLTGPGSNAKSDVRVSGVSFDSTSGEKRGDLQEETLTVGEDGAVDFSLSMAEGVLLELVKASDDSCANSGASGEGVAAPTRLVSTTAAVVAIAACVLFNFAL